MCKRSHISRTSIEKNAFVKQLFIGNCGSGFVGSKEDDIKIAEVKNIND